MCTEPVTWEKSSEMMKSDDYKERFIAEYAQTRMRYARLKAYCNRIEAACQYMTDVEEPPHTCPFELLRDQLYIMEKYLHVLEVRAVIEGIKF